VIHDSQLLKKKLEQEAGEVYKAEIDALQALELLNKTSRLAPIEGGSAAQIPPRPEG
jgi:hypothetical protein